MTTNNVNYRITIKNEFYTVIGNLPNSFGMTVSNSYKSVLDLIGEATGGIGGAAVGVADSLSKIAGFSVKGGDEMTQLVYQRTDPISFDLNIKFIYKSNATNDVMNPIRSLLALSVPEAIVTDGISVIRHPSGLNDPKYKISMSIGKLAYLDDVIIESVAPEFESRFTPEGVPIAVGAQVRILAAKMLYQKQIINMLSGPPLGNIGGTIGDASQITDADAKAIAAALRQRNVTLGQSSSGNVTQADASAVASQLRIRGF